MDIIESKLDYYTTLDNTAKTIAKSLTKGNDVTGDIMNVVIDLYKSAKVELNFNKENEFLSAYHPPITPELEFVISRLLLHFSNLNKLNWQVFLRSQKHKTAPDIRIERNGKTIGIIEIKAKGGFIQPFLSSDKFKYDTKQYKAGISKVNPKELVKKSRNQLKKYAEAFDISLDQIYFFLPTLNMVHFKRYDREVYEYTEYFTKVSGLPKDSFILLSKNKDLDLSNPNKGGRLEPTKAFERMMYRLKRQ